MQSFGCSTISMFAFVMSPSTRSFGRSPAVMCRSEAPRSIISSRRTRRLRLDCPALGAVIGRWLVASGERRVWKRGPVGTRHSHLATSSGGRLAYHLLHRRNPLDHLHPRVHAEREHSLFDRTIADLGGAGVHDDHPANLRTHRHHLVYALASLQPRAAARIAASALEEAELSDRRIERQVLQDRRGFLRRLGLRVRDRDRKSTRLNSSHDQISYAVVCLT